MNAADRKRISDITDRLAGIYDTLDEIAESEESKYDRMPEQFRESEKGEKMQEWIDALYAAMGEIEEAQNSLGSVE